MIHYLILLSCLGAISGSPLSQPVHNDMLIERVIGGHEAARNSWKWQVSLQIADAYYPEYFSHICGGTLISPHWVMTAAHCIQMPLQANYQVALGEHNLFELDGTEYSVGVDKIFIHEDWNPRDIGNGIPPGIVQRTNSYGPVSAMYHGDSGGPLQCYRDGRWQIHGIVSYGIVPYCNTYQKPTVFTRVSAYINWIYNTMENNGGY
ncbi:chymotrypsin-like elastase family member 2A [Trachemys scripta elegans]|uniref:chymotrypsin-like elastase family member 2A n=1 Tax=Trachemys scripta elegans TaxID=31138 RepID=UPI001551DE30|nr:chymotrypsin-like elastase family member 2A [Trachemys scripta elegans]